MGKAWIDGAPAPFAEAVSAAALRLASSRLPLVTGLATDVAGVRAAVGLAEAAGGVVDHARSAALYRNLDVLRRSGLFRGVPAELRRRCDRVLVVGGDAAEVAPELLTFLLKGSPDLGRGVEETRRSVWLGGADGAGPPGLYLDVVPMSPEDISGFVGAMRASLAKRRFDAAAPAVGRAAEIAAWLAGAKFAAVVWSVGTLDTIAVESLAGLVVDLNAQTRASAVPLAEAGEAHGAAEVATWLCGYPLRTSFARGEAEHDPLILDGERLVASGECDLVIHVDARAGVTLGLYERHVPAISIASAPMVERAAIAFEVAPAGTGGGEALWDERLASFVSSEGPVRSDRTTAAEVLSAIRDALEPLASAGRAA